MPRTVFWSWQSDRDERVTRQIVREALARALEQAQSETAIEERIELDHDTRDVPGTPDIVASILAKIEAATVFVADLTPIAVSDSGKHLPNPNVLIELGYAKKALGTAQMIAVWNTAFTNCHPEDLPFDLRGRRGPVAYSLPAGADTQAYRTARESLTRELVRRISGCLSAAPTPVPISLEWAPDRSDDRALWAQPASPILANVRHVGGKKLALKGDVHCYARMLPSSFSPAMLDSGQLPPPVGGWGSWSAGNTAVGSIMFPAVDVTPDVLQLPSATIWYRETGELWSVETDLTFESEGSQRFNTVSVVAFWMQFLDRASRHLDQYGGTRPYHVRFGTRGMSGLAWPDKVMFGATPIALRDNIDRETVISSTANRSWLPDLLSAWTELNSAFSRPAPSPAQIDDMLARYG